MMDLTGMIWNTYSQKFPTILEHSERKKPYQKNLTEFVDVIGDGFQMLFETIVIFKHRIQVR